MFKFTPNNIPTQIMVIGCGGTGSRLVPLLTQFIASITKDKNPRGWLDNPTIYLVDDDVVEQKNLLRQNFVAADVGKHKASVLAQRYSRAYGVNIVPILKRVDGTRHILQQQGSMINLNRSIIIMCVDSAQARRDIIKMVNDTNRPINIESGAFFIDAGNEDNFGQVRFFNQAVAFHMTSFKAEDFPKNSPVVLDIPAIPIDLRYYDELEDLPSQGSCADLDQTLAINALMATLIMGVVQNYYYVKPMTYNQISISLDGGVSTSYNTVSTLLRWAEPSNRNAQPVNRVRWQSFATWDCSAVLKQYKQKSDRILKQIQATTIAETAVERLGGEEKTAESVLEEIPESTTLPPIENVTAENAAYSNT